MANLLSGRTDNNIKNRFHHLRRKLEKDVERFAKKAQREGQSGKENASDGTSNAMTASLDSSLAQRLQVLVNERVSGRDTTTFQRKVSTVVGYVAAEAIEQRQKREPQQEGSETVVSLSKKTRISNKKNLNSSCDEHEFRTVDPRDMERCQKCHLFLPSKQCGTKIHRVTHWCESCSAVPCYISRDTLYDTLWTIGQDKAKSS